MAERILVIEDEETVADILAINLRLEGFEVETALTGSEGLALAREGGFDVTICDVMMPDVDGYEICRELKANEHTSQVPLLLLTARSEVEDKVAALEVGADDFITKPFNFSELLARINLNLDRCANRYAVDSVTGMPGSVALDDTLKQRVLTEGPIALLLVSVNGFRPFREVYGDARLEEVVRFTAETVAEVVKKQGSRKDFTAYLGGDTFSIITVPDRAEQFARSIIKLFESRITAFYSDGDVERGDLITFDRRGGVVHNPLMTVSVGGVSNVNRPLRSHWEAAEIAREVLDYAKTLPGSAYFMDRRKEKR